MDTQRQRTMTRLVPSFTTPGKRCLRPIHVVGLAAAVVQGLILWRFDGQRWENDDVIIPQRKPARDTDDAASTPSKPLHRVPYGLLHQSEQAQEGQNDTVTANDVVDKVDYRATLRDDDDPSLVVASNNNNNNATTFYEWLMKQDCMADIDIYKCHKCLGNTDRGNPSRPGCFRCEDACGCFCELMCVNETVVPPLPVTKKYLVEVPPLSERRDGDRLIPRILHQTYAHNIDPNVDPRLHRYSQSWRDQTLVNPNWEYRFYDNDDAVAFLSMHFPPEFLQTFEAIIAGASKADFFRNCILFIHGGIYADIDIMRYYDLEDAVPDDVGFMIPVHDTSKYPGALDNLPSLWNGYMASAPGHPILARTLEQQINNVRNRHNLVDFLHHYCPHPEFHKWNKFPNFLFLVTFILGQVLNEMLGRDPQTPYTRAGDVVVPGVSSSDFGRTHLMLSGLQGSFPFQLILGERNLIVAGVNDPTVPFSHEEKRRTRAKHYASGMVDNKNPQIFGLYRVYVDQQRAYERIELTVSNE